MDEASLKALDEAGRLAATETLRVLSSMGDCDIVPLVVIDKAEAIGSNSLDVTFYQSLIEGMHLNEKFLQNASQ